MRDPQDTPPTLATVGAKPVAIPVGLGGLAGGRELSGAGILHFDGRMLRIESRPEAAGDPDNRTGREPALMRRGAPRLQWPVAYLDGVRYREEELTLYLRNGDIIELTGPTRLGAVADAIEADARTLGELTRGLRSLGARRRGVSPGAEQSRFFAPLMHARRAVESPRRGRPRDELAAFDADMLRESIGAAVAELAAGRYGSSAPHRRALHAELEECAEPLVDGMAHLAQAANAVRRAPDDTRLVLWRAWATEVQRLFERADRCWCSMVPVLAEAPPPPRRPWWRRVLRLNRAHGRPDG